jgi:hypothetical protein
MKAFGSRMRYHRSRKERKTKEREERVNQKKKNFFWIQKGKKEYLIYSAHMKP